MNDKIIISAIVGAAIWLIIRLVGERGFWMLFIGGIGIMIFVFGNAPVLKKEPEIIPHPSAAECANPDAYRLPRNEQDILLAGCKGFPTQYPH